MFKIIKKEIITKKLEGFYLKKSEKTKFGGMGEGGVYRDKSSGKDYLLKRISIPGERNPDKLKEMNWRSWDEILAAKFLKAAGVLVPNMFAVEDKNGVVYVASSMIPGVKNCLKDDFKKLPAASKDVTLASQLMHCWLGNRDIVNQSGENFVVDSDSRVFNVDLGAALFSGFRSIVHGQDTINFNSTNIESFLIDKTNKNFGKLKKTNGQTTDALNKKDTQDFFSELISTDANERKYLLQGTKMIMQFSDKDIEDLVNSTGHTQEDKKSRIDVLKGRKECILQYVQNKYGVHALKEEQIALELQRIFHKYGLYNPHKNSGGSDAIVSYRAQYTNAIKPDVKINEDGTITIKVDDKDHSKALPIIQRLAETKAIGNTNDITIRLPINEFITHVQKDLVENALQIFFSSFGYLSKENDEFHRNVYKGDGYDGFRPVVTAKDTLITISLPKTNDPQEILNHLSDQFNITLSAMKIENNVLHIDGSTLPQLANHLMQNTGARKTAVVSEDKDGKILAGELDWAKKGVGGFATAGGGSDYPYNPVRAAREEGTDEFGHSIDVKAPLIPIGSTLPNKKKNIFLVQPEGTALKADKVIGYQEFQDQSIKYYSFSEFREAYKKDKSKFDRSSVDLYIRHYQREIQKAFYKQGIDNVIVFISKKPATLGKISLKPSIDSYVYHSNQVIKLNDECKKWMEELLGKDNIKSFNKNSQHGKLKTGNSKIVVRECLEFSDDKNPARLHSILVSKVDVNKDPETVPVNPQYLLQKHQSKFVELLKQLQDIEEKLDKKSKYDPEYLKIAKEISSLNLTLNDSQKCFFDSPTAEAFQAFMSKCETAFVKAEAEAKNHRGWHQIHPIIRGLAGVLAAISILGIFIVEFKSNHGFLQTFFKKPETATSQQITSFKTEFEEQRKSIGKLVR